jgi:hypothetical protein
MTYYFIDPGETTGWAKFNDKGETITLGQVKGFDNFCTWLEDNIEGILSQKLYSEEHIPEMVCVEEFKLYPWKSQAQMWSEFITCQVIGAIKFRCYQFGIKVQMLRAADYPMGFRFQGLDVPPHSNPLHDQLVAHAHGVFWLQKNGIRKPQAR